jgi:hypothetical protein
MSFLQNYRTALATRKPRTRGSYVRQTLYCTAVFSLFFVYAPAADYSNMMSPDGTVAPNPTVVMPNHLVVAP